MAITTRPIIFELESPVTGKIRNGLARSVEVQNYEDGSIRMLRVTAVMDEDIPRRETREQADLLCDMLTTIKDGLNKGTYNDTTKL
jgi:hypothetical protein